MIKRVAIPVFLNVWFMIFMTKSYPVNNKTSCLKYIYVNQIDPIKTGPVPPGVGGGVEIGGCFALVAGG